MVPVRYNSTSPDLRDRNFTLFQMMSRSDDDRCFQLFVSLMTLIVNCQRRNRQQFRDQHHQLQCQVRSGRATQLKVSGVLNLRTSPPPKKHSSSLFFSPFLSPPLLIFFEISSQKVYKVWSLTFFFPWFSLAFRMSPFVVGFLSLQNIHVHWITKSSKHIKSYLPVAEGYITNNLPTIFFNHHVSSAFNLNDNRDSVWL